MQQRFAVVKALPPSKLKGVALAPAGFGYKHRPISTDDVLWEKKGWESLLPATNLPARWVKVIGGKLVWAIKVKEIMRRNPSITSSAPETIISKGIYLHQTRKPGRVLKFQKYQQKVSLALSNGLNHLLNTSKTK